MSCCRFSLIGVLFVTGCAHVPPRHDNEVAMLVDERIHKRVSWNPEPAMQSLIMCLLQQELKLDAAVQIALINNPTIQQTFEELGIAEADLIQAGLLRNPIFDGFLRFPGTNAEFSVTQNFIDLFLIPLKKRVAETECELVQLKVAHKVVQIAFDVEKAYYSLAYAYEKQGFLQQIVEIAEIEQEIAEKQFEAGNINQLALQLHRRKYAESVLQLQKCQIELAHLQKEFSVLLGIQNSAWHIAKPVLQVVQIDEVSLSSSSRLDLQALKVQERKIAELGATKQWWTYTDGSLGVSWENDIDGSKVFGPAFGCMLPFFNTGQADRARLFAELKQTAHAARALELDILTHIELAKQKMAILQENHAHALVQIQEKAVAVSDALYSVMGLGVYALLDSKKQEFQAKIMYAESCLGYALAKIELEMALGRRFDL